MKPTPMATLLGWPIRIIDARVTCKACGELILETGSGPLRTLVDAVEHHIRERHPETVG